MGKRKGEQGIFVVKNMGLLFMLLFFGFLVLLTKLPSTHPAHIPSYISLCWGSTP